jgi:hypothetical protein
MQANGAFPNLEENASFLAPSERSTISKITLNFIAFGVSITQQPIKGGGI